MAFGEGQFEKPKTGDKVGPEEEKPVEGQPGEETAEQPKAPEAAGPESGPEEEMTEEKIEARFQERRSKLEELKKEVGVRYGWDFPSLVTGVKDSRMGLRREPLFRDKDLIALIEAIDQKELEIYDERKKSIAALEEKRRAGLKEKLEGI